MSYREELIVTCCYSKLWAKLPFSVRRDYGISREDSIFLGDIYFKGLSQSEISRLEGVSRQAVSQRKQRIIKNIKKAFLASNYTWDLENNALIAPDGARYRFE